MRCLKKKIKNVNIFLDKPDSGLWNGLEAMLLQNEKKNDTPTLTNKWWVVDNRLWLKELNQQNNSI